MAIFENIIMVFMTIIIIVLYLIYQTLCNIQLKNKKIMIGKKNIRPYFYI